MKSKGYGVTNLFQLDLEKVGRSVVENVRSTTYLHMTRNCMLILASYVQMNNTDDSFLH